MRDLFFIQTPPVPEDAKIPPLILHEKLSQNYKRCIIFFFFDGQQQQVTSCTDEKRAEAVAFPSSYYGIFHCFYFPFKVGNEGKMKAQILSFHSSALLDRAQTVCVWAYIRIIYSLIPGRVAPFSSCFLKQGSPSLIKRTSFSLCTIH